MNLQLSLKAKWFEMTKAGIKTEDYREITPYWCNRLLFKNKVGQTKTFWESFINQDCFKNEIAISNVSFKNFTQNTMTLGYPKSTDTERILKLEHKGIEIRTGNPDWGAEPGKLYFVILHGKQII